MEESLRYLVIFSFELRWSLWDLTNWRKGIRKGLGMRFRDSVSDRLKGYGSRRQLKKC